MDEQLLREFLAEAEELIEKLFGDIQALRARHTEGRARRELIGRIFRHVHTLKGSAAAAGLQPISQIGHEVETLLDGVRAGRIPVDGPVLDAFDDAANAIAFSLIAVGRGESPEAPQTFLEYLRRFVPSEPPKTTDGRATAALDSLPADVRQSLVEYERHRLREAAQEGALLFVVAADFDLATFDESFRALSETLAEAGEIISTLPGMGESAPEKMAFRILYATQESQEETAKRVAPFGAVVTGVSGETTTGEAPSPEAKGETTGAAEPFEESLGVSLFESAAPQNALVQAAVGEESVSVESRPAATPPLLTLVRVPLDVLDNLVSATHELFADTIAALDYTLSINLARSERTEMEIRTRRIRRRFLELERQVIELRMVPVGQALERAARAGQMAARAAGKEIDFEVAGGEVQLDKSLADAIADPLLHILRNAVDHGIESPAERRNSGKSERGHIRLEAVAEGSRVLVRVTDDGRGIDTARVTRTAIERGLIAPGTKLTDEQCLRLIFQPGFSTAPIVTSMSGRGVGLDVVESTVEQFGGELRLFSRRGLGTTLEMRLPTTLALMPSLVVSSTDQRYCIDASHIVETGYVASSDIDQIGSAQATLWRGAVVPLIHLRTLLAQPETTSAGAQGEQRIPVVISRIAGQEKSNGEDRPPRCAAVAVDGWDGHREVLVRSLGRHAMRWRGINGATELHDGTVALILDLPRLLEMHL